MSDSNRKPPWIRAKIPSGCSYQTVKDTKKKYGLATVCEEAACPNQGICWEKKHATFMLLGKICTRNCFFCNVSKSRSPVAPDPDEPFKVAKAVRELGIRYCVLTSVTRDDLPDGGAQVFASTVYEIKKASPDTLIELLIPDFQGQITALETVVQSEPNVIGHNLETCRRICESVRPMANYDRSLSVVKNIKSLTKQIFTKSAFMVGLGETDAEIEQMLSDLALHQVDIVYIGQYLQPSVYHVPVSRYIPEQEIKRWECVGKQLGIRYLKAGVFVRSSFEAEGALSFLKG